MSSGIVFLIIVAHQLVEASYISHVVVAVPEEYIFKKVNFDLHNAVQRLFKSMNFFNVTKSTEKYLSLLNLHKDIVRRADKFHTAIGIVENIASSDFNHSIMRKAIEEIVFEFADNDNRKNKENYEKSTPFLLSKPNSNTTNVHNTLKKWKIKDRIEDTELPSNFLKKFMAKINNITVEAFIKNKSELFMQGRRSSLRNKITKRRFYKSFELKPWLGPIHAKKNRTRRLYAGKVMKIKFYPFIVSVHVNDKMACSGSIISKDLIISAASCLQLAFSNVSLDYDTSLVTVRVGSSFATLAGENVQASELYFHPEYSPMTLRNNLVIIRLQRILIFSKENQKKIRRIEYEREEEPLARDVKQVSVVGWGARYKDNSETIPVLQEDFLPIYDKVDCQEIYSRRYVTEKHFCAGFRLKGGGACGFDVGGPGILKSKLVGIISFGPPLCGISNAPTVFTKIGYHARWIDSIRNMPIPKKLRHHQSFHLGTAAEFRATGLTTETLDLTNTNKRLRERKIMNKLNALTNLDDMYVQQRSTNTIQLLREILTELITTYGEVMVDQLLNDDFGKQMQIILSHINLKNLTKDELNDISGVQQFLQLFRSAEDEVSIESSNVHSSKKRHKSSPNTKHKDAKNISDERRAKSAEIVFLPYSSEYHIVEETTDKPASRFTTVKSTDKIRPIADKSDNMHVNDNIKESLMATLFKHRNKNKSGVNTSIESKIKKKAFNITNISYKYQNDSANSLVISAAAHLTDDVNGKTESKIKNETLNTGDVSYTYKNDTENTLALSEAAYDTGLINDLDGETSEIISNILMQAENGSKLFDDDSLLSIIASVDDDSVLSLIENMNLHSSNETIRYLVNNVSRAMNTSNNINSISYDSTSTEESSNYEIVSEDASRDGMSIDINPFRSQKDNYEDKSNESSGEGVPKYAKETLLNITYSGGWRKR